MSSLSSSPAGGTAKTTLPPRSQHLAALASSSPSNPFDVLVIGGGATGSGIALDAASRGLRVACVDRSDFGGETSSRSTKLVWAGIRYVATAAASLLSRRTLVEPVASVKDFIAEFKMVLGCHRERAFMINKNRHLVNWVPIAMPFTSYVVWPPPFGHPLFALFPLLSPFVLKFYDSMSSFQCPPSYCMGPARAKATFPQLSDRSLKFVSVFYELQHNDARTNLAIALSAASRGATIANYVECVSFLPSGDGSLVGGCTVVDTSPGGDRTPISVYAKRVVLAAGPFTDSVRAMKGKGKTNDDAPFKKAVQGSAGSHIVLPSYYAPRNIGMLDYNTSDGRFLFFLPWQGHTLVGTTDNKGPAKTSPAAPEDEVQWLLNECGKYLSKDLLVRRSDVTSSWRGWRPLAVDPSAPAGSPPSRDHVVSYDDATGLIFVAGGKWTTWREMAEHAVDKVLQSKGDWGDARWRPCVTKDITLWGGGDGFSDNLAIQLTQKHGMDERVAEHLSRTYGSKAFDVCLLSAPTGKDWPKFGIPISPQFPYIDAEVSYACKHEYALTVKDVLSLRMRLAFLNGEAARAAVPTVAAIMKRELGWSDEEEKMQRADALEYLKGFGGPVPDKRGAELRSATFHDVEGIFKAIDEDGSGFLDRTEVGHAAKALGFEMTPTLLDEAFSGMNTTKDGRVTLEQFEKWWNSPSNHSPLHEQLHKEIMLGAKDVKGLAGVGSGALLG